MIIGSSFNVGTKWANCNQTSLLLQSDWKANLNLLAKLVSRYKFGLPPKMH